MKSRRAIKSLRPAPRFSFAIVAVGLIALSTLAIIFFYSRGCILYYGDADAHLSIARRIIDSRTPGYDQVGTSWLPLPHWLMLPLVRYDALWLNGLAGASPSAISFVLAGIFLYAGARRVFGYNAAAIAAVDLLAVNPGVIYF